MPYVVENSAQPLSGGPFGAMSFCAVRAAMRETRQRQGRANRWTRTIWQRLMVWGDLARVMAAMGLLLVLVAEGGLSGNDGTGISIISGHAVAATVEAAGPVATDAAGPAAAAIPQAAQGGSILPPEALFFAAPVVAGLLWLVLALCRQHPGMIFSLPKGRFSRRRG